MSERSLLFFSFTFTLAIMSTELIGRSHGSATTIHCHETERKALVEFKRGLHDPSNRLFSWASADCCAWEGVSCNNITGHVIKLDLRNRHRTDPLTDCSYPNDLSVGGSGCKQALRDGISPSLLSLEHLNHLDLSGNHFEHNTIPEFLGSFRRLTYLNLSAAGFTGKVPDQLGNLSTLHCLDLSYNMYLDVLDGYYSPGLHLEDPTWTSRLTSLRQLNMSWVDYGGALNWLQALNALPHIQEVELANCNLGLQGTLPLSLPQVNFTSLTTLNLHFNDINSTVPDWLFNITSLEYLNLGWNILYWFAAASVAKLTSLRALDLSGNVFPNGFTRSITPGVVSNLCKLQSLSLDGVRINDALANLEVVFSGCLMFSLEELHLSGTQITGSLPYWLKNIKNLKYLDLSINSLYGSVPASLGNLSQLQYVDFNSNSLNGMVSEHIGQLRGLVHLDLGYNYLSLSEVHLANLSSLKFLEISNNSILLKEGSGWIPPFQLQSLLMDFGKILPRPHFPEWIRTQETLSMLILKGVGIHDAIPNWLPVTLEVLDLSDNEITGEVPQYFSNLLSLDLSNNSLSGHLPPRLENIMPSLLVLSLFMNSLSGGIPRSFCQLHTLQRLRLSTNNLSGELPDCWTNSSDTLVVLDFANNNLYGGIPGSLCNLPCLESLHLRHNNLSGKIPSCLESCTNFVVVDLGHNNLTGNIPNWSGQSLSYLKILILRSNAFTGIIPPFSFLESLQVLDLSNNNLWGTIPQSFGNFSAMKASLPTGYFLVGGVQEDMWFFMKGSELDYSSWQVSLVTIIDLSNNHLTGSVPEELGNLYGLESLNLSGNCLTGEIPRSISGMKLLEILDLSKNNLSGAIPSSLSSLTFLSHLNLSYNHLSGRIPTGNQLQTLADPSIYVGNPNLCGPPLTKKCANGVTKGNKGKQAEDIKNRIEIIWFYMSIALGYIVGFWAICGILILQRRWRITFFRATDNMYDRLYVAVAVNMKKFLKKGYL